MKRRRSDAGPSGPAYSCRLQGSRRAVARIDIVICVAAFVLISAGLSLRRRFASTGSGMRSAGAVRPWRAAHSLSRAVAGVPADALAAEIALLEPWRGRQDYRPEDWRRLIRVAILVQRTDSRSVEEALDKFLESAPNPISSGGEQESKPYLLLRTVFKVPEAAPADRAEFFKGWSCHEDEVIPANVNLAWPMSWSAGRPRLIAAYEGSMGPAYDALGEYRYMRSHFAIRNLRIDALGE